MSLSSALSIAGSGLAATQTWADTTSRNIANANTAGYVRKETLFATRSGNVEVAAIRREVDAMLDRMARSEGSKLSALQATAEGIEAYAALLGQPDDAVSPANRLNAFQISLQELAGNSGNTALQRGVLDMAQSLARGLNEASANLSGIAAEVELSIRYDVSDLNEALQQVAELNRQISATSPGGVQVAELQDELGRRVDEISGFLDVQMVQASDGRISLYTSGGTQLVEGSRAVDVVYDQASGMLSAGGVDITPGRPGVRGFEAGSLAGLFDLKTNHFPTFQLQLDEMARGLVQGFEQADASLAPGQAGLFTDLGAAFDPAALEGLAGRISVNAAVDPAQGGTLGLLRDGLGATAPGETGDPRQITAFLEVFDAPLGAAAGTGLDGSLTLASYAVTMVAAQQTARSDALAAYDAQAITTDTVSSARANLQGVSTDDELQKLLLIEQTYAANSRMMSAVITMMDTLLQAV